MTSNAASPVTGTGMTEEEAIAVLRGLARTIPAEHPIHRAETADVEQKSVSTRSVREAPIPTADRAERRQHQLAFGPEEFRGLLEAAPDAMVIVNANGAMVLVNTQTERMFGYTREELLGQPVELLVPEHARRRHILHRDSYFASPHARPMGAGLELYGRRKGGEEFPVEISLSPLETESGLLAISSIRDISERRQTQALLRKLEARYRTLVEGIPAVTFMAALDEGVNELYVSPQIEALLGFSQKEWLDDPVLWHTQLHPDDRARWHIEFAHTCATGEPFRSIYRFRARDGRTVWVHGEAKVVRDVDGRPIFLQGVAFDITGMKQAEEELKALNLTLEERVAERTAVAEQRAQELARSNSDLEQFAYVASHDLQEPLRAVTGFTQKLERRHQGQLDATSQDYIGRIVGGAKRMQRLIEDLLAYSRVGRQGKPSALTDCNIVFAEACNNLRAAIEEGNASVTADVLPTVHANRMELGQLFQNLIGNAIKFRGDRPAQVHVGVQREGADWRFLVRDNGIGIDPKYAERIFVIFQRLHGRKEYPGTGIGLAICKKIVERHGGHIRVESQPGQGCTFHFTLPAGTFPG